MWDTNGGVYFGYGCDRTEGPPPGLQNPLRYVGDRHVMTIGPNGSGKSRRLLLPNLAQLTGWSVLVVDPKGELAYMTAKYRDPALQNTVLLNPFGVLDLPSHGFNPVAALDPDSPDFPDDVLGLAEAMIRVEGREPHWSASAQDLVAALIMYSRLTQDDGGSLAHVRECLGRPYDKFRDMVERMLTIAGDKHCEELAIKAGRYAEIDPESRELNAVLSTALTQTRWLDSRPVKADLEKNGAFDFSVMKERPTTVYLILPARRIGTHATWLRLMIASIIQPLMRDTRKAKVPVMLMLDEFYALAEGGFPVIEKNMAMFRGYGIKLWTVWQDLAQAQKLYGDGYESFVANCGVLQAFAPQDVITSEYLSKRTGLTGVQLQAYSRTLNTNPGKPTSRSESTNVNLQPIPQVLPQDLRNMDDGFSVMFTHKTKNTVRGYMPFRVPGLEPVYRLDPAT
jgi:type IV secretion system protein VirD4